MEPIGIVEERVESWTVVGAPEGRGGQDDSQRHGQASRANAGRQHHRADGGRRADGGWGRTLAKGMVAGVVATGAMVAVRDAMWKRERPEVREREERLREGAETTPLQQPLRQAAEAAGKPLDKSTEKKVGRALAWGLGVGGVAAYAALRERWPQAGVAQGAGFGVAMWALEDELMMSALGFARPPAEYPWQAHARGLVAHVAYGVAAESTLDALDRVW